MRRLQPLVAIVLVGAMFSLTGCLWGGDNKRKSYWRGVEKMAASQSSERAKSSAPERPRERSYAPKPSRERSASRESGRLKRFTNEGGSKTRALLDFLLEHGQLVRVKPWERDLVALEEMGWDPDSLQSLRRSHIYFSKEASLVGGSAGGGGCGCN